MSAERIDLPPRVRRAIEICAADHGVAIGQVLAGSHVAAVCKARRQAAQTLRKMGFSQPETGRYLKMHASSVSYAEHHPRVKVEDWTVPIPDFSGEWAI